MNKRYNILSVIGKGNFGTTYHAFDNFLGKDVALKKIEGVDTQHKEEIFSEIDTMINLSNLPLCNEYIVCYYDSFEEKDNSGEYVYIVSEYIVGETLQKYIKSNYIMEPRIILTIMSMLVSGLQYIHNNDYVHGDIKLDNIMITSDGKIKYIDFGLSCSAVGTIPCSKKRPIAILYTSPDYYLNNIRNLSIAKSNDVWALGLVFYQLCNFGRFPFSILGNNTAQKNSIINSKFKQSSYHYKPINTYIDSFLIKNYQLRPDINEQYQKILILMDDYDFFLQQSRHSALSDENQYGYYSIDHNEDVDISGYIY